MPTLLLYLTALLLLLTKAADCYTTHKYMRHAGQERNRLARRWMLRYGVGPVVWTVFGAVVLFTGVHLWLVLYLFNTWYWQLGFIILGLAVAYTQAAVAHTNYTGRLNAFTRWLSRQRHYRG